MSKYSKWQIKYCVVFGDSSNIQEGLWVKHVSNKYWCYEATHQHCYPFVSRHSEIHQKVKCLCKTCLFSRPMDFCFQGLLTQRDTRCGSIGQFGGMFFNVDITEPKSAPPLAQILCKKYQILSFRSVTEYHTISSSQQECVCLCVCQCVCSAVTFTDREEQQKPSGRGDWGTKLTLHDRSHHKCSWVHL